MSIVKCRHSDCNIMTGIALRAYASAHRTNVRQRIPRAVQICANVQYEVLYRAKSQIKNT